MKKIISVAIIIALILTGFAVGNVYAANTCKIKITPSATEIKSGETVEFTFSTLELNSDGGSDEGLLMMTGSIEYDKTIFDTISTSDITASTGWTKQNYNPNNGAITLSRTKVTKTDVDIFKVKLKAKTNVTSENASVKFISAAAGFTVKNASNEPEASQYQMADTVTGIKVSAAGTTNPGTTTPGTTDPGTSNPGTTTPGTSNPITINPSTANNGSTTNNSNSGSSASTSSSTTSSNKSSSSLPKTGVEELAIPAITVLSVIGTIGFVGYRRMRY